MEKGCKYNYFFIILFLIIIGILFIPIISAADVQISTCQQLQDIRNNVVGGFITGDYILTNNIDCSATSNPSSPLWNGGAGFIPIGNSSRQFNGTFNGNNYAISNLYINRPSENYVGLFGVAVNSNMKNVGLVNVNIAGVSDIGSLVGRNNGGEITNSYATGSVKGHWFGFGLNIGGLVGWSNGGNISNSYSTANVNGDGFVGGLVGWSNGGNISNSFSTGSVNGSSGIGGLVGRNDVGGNGEFPYIINSYSTGSVTGPWFAGGFNSENQGNISNSFSTGSVNGNGNLYTYTGGFVGSNRGTISNSFSTGSVTGDWMVGGFASENRGNISNSFSTGSVNGNQYIGGLVASNYIDTSKISNSYWNKPSGSSLNCWANDTGNYNINCTAINNNVSYFKGDVYPNRQPFMPWPFFSTWQERANDYPSLTWQNLGGNINSSGGGNPSVQIQISTCQQLQDIRNNVIGGFITGDYILMNNIDCSATSGWNGGLGFRPVGNETNPFTGTFNGNNYNITNLY